MLDEILKYAEGLYSMALERMKKEQFRKADIYALSAYGAASFVAAQKSIPEEMREIALELEHASWRLAKRAYGSARMSLMEPRLSGRDDEDLEEVRWAIHQEAAKASR